MRRQQRLIQTLWWIKREGNASPHPSFLFQVSSAAVDTGHDGGDLCFNLTHIKISEFCCVFVTSQCTNPLDEIMPALCLIWAKFISLFLSVKPCFTVLALVSTISETNESNWKNLTKLSVAEPNSFLWRGSNNFSLYHRNFCLFLKVFRSNFIKSLLFWSLLLLKRIELTQHHQR